MLQSSNRLGHYMRLSEMLHYGGLQPYIDQSECLNGNNSANYYLSDWKGYCDVAEKICSFVGFESEKGSCICGGGI